jgi:hypothetical protein
MGEPPRICCLCWIDGVRSKAVDHWPHFPICQEHLTESLIRTCSAHYNVISLADARKRLRPPVSDSLAAMPKNIDDVGQREKSNG